MFIEVQSLKKKFGLTDVLNGVSFGIERGETVALLGPSGCGKTTVLRIIAGLEQPTSGFVLIEKVDCTALAPHLRGMGMVFQSYALWPHLNVEKNISFPLTVGRWKGALTKKQVTQKTQEVIELVELSGLEKRMTSELSGGQQQRVALARAIVMEPKLLLLDEPLSNLDAKLREQMRKQLKILTRRLRLTSLYVTHDRAEAFELADRMAILDRGNLVQMGTPEEISHNPANEFVAHLVR